MELSYSPRGSSVRERWNKLPVVFALSVGLFSPTLTFCHSFCNIEDSNFIFGMHVYLMELHILSGERSRSSFKVKGQNIPRKVQICFSFVFRFILFLKYHSYYTMPPNNIRKLDPNQDTLDVSNGR